MVPFVVLVPIGLPLLSFMVVVVVELTTVGGAGAVDMIGGCVHEVGVQSCVTWSIPR